MNSSGFYKLDDGNLLVGQHIYGPDFELHAETHSEVSQADGWEWFESEEDAQQALMPLFL